MLRATVCGAILLGVAMPVAAFQAGEAKKTPKGEAAAAKVEAKKAEAKADAKAAAKKETKGRLPANYSKIVDDSQRARIYGIQADFNPRIEALEAQVKELIAERDFAVRAVLTPEQEKQLDDLEGKVKSKKSEKTEKSEKTVKGDTTTKKVDEAAEPPTKATKSTK